MPISSLMLSTADGQAPTVVRTVQDHPGITVAGVSGNRVAVLTETRTRAEDRDIWDALENTEHVVGVNLVYHNFEDLEDQ
jgi:nitrate reductase NapAB chaperone NapD